MLFDYELFIRIFTALALGAGTVGLFFFLLGQLRKASTGTPTETAILSVLEPLAYQAIFAGEAAARMGFQAGEDYLKGLDRQQIAVSTYNVLPDNLSIGGKLYSIAFIKMLIPLESWSALVERVYQSALAFVLANKEYFQKQVEAIKPPQQSARTSTGQG